MLSDFSGLRPKLALYITLTIAAAYVARGATEACPNNSIKYSGEYNVVTESGLGYLNGTVLDVGAFETTHVILPGLAKNSFVIKKLAHLQPEDGDIREGNNSSITVENVPAETLCIAPPYPSAGLECVDVEDIGISRVTPLEVDEDCNMIKGWMVYIEPTLPDCSKSRFCSLSGYATLSRVGATTSTIPAVSGAAGRLFSAPLATIIVWVMLGNAFM